MRFLKTTVATATLGAALMLAPANAAPIGSGAGALGGAGQQASQSAIQTVQFRRGGSARIGPVTIHRGAAIGGGYRGGGYRGYRGGYRGYRGGYYRGYRGGWGWGGGGLAAGIATGALLGSALAASPYYAPPYSGGYYVEQVPVDSAVEYCMRRFRSYDPRSGTYLGYDGRRHPCP